MASIRVMVVDDSAFMRQTIKGMIEENPLFAVVATARNGQDALKKLMLYKPDAITLDIVMGGDMDGLQVLQQIMIARPTPTIMVSGASDENVNYVIEAISNGAFDFICKPNGKPSDIERIEMELQIKLKQAALSKRQLDDSALAKQEGSTPAYLLAAREMKAPEPPQEKRSADWVQRSSLPAEASASVDGLVVIGTSTGGPKALQTVVPGLDKDLPVPVLIIQHMPPRFTRSLAQRLNQISKLTVSEAEEGEVLKKGHAYIAPGGRHLQIIKSGSQLAVHLQDTAAVHGVRPAIDVTLESLLKINDRPYIFAILTGMGRDGADGLEALKNSNEKVFAIAEAEQSCVVFGMPKAAIETGKINQVSALPDIASAINRQFVIRRGN